MGEGKESEGMEGRKLKQFTTKNKMFTGASGACHALPSILLLLQLAKTILFTRYFKEHSVTSDLILRSVRELSI